MSRVREAKVTLPCSKVQKALLQERAADKGLSVSNYLRFLLEWPLEQQGHRKDLSSASQTTLPQVEPKNQQSDIKAYQRS